MSEKKNPIRVARRIARFAAALLAILILVGVACVKPEPTRKPKDRTPRPRQGQAKSTSAPAAEEPFVAADSIPGRIHIVQRGDTLWSLAERYYGSGKHLHKIRLANRNRLFDPKDLPVGMKLIIP